LACVFFVHGCGGQVDRSISLEDAKVKAETMDVKQLMKKAKSYSSEIEKQQNKIQDVQSGLKGLSPRDLIGDKGKEIKEKMKVISDDVEVLMKRYGVYARKYKELGGDLSKIKIG
jgi:uncharacterized coiled-coil DUF342 family protein